MLGHSELLSDPYQFVMLLFFNGIGIVAITILLVRMNNNFSRQQECNRKRQEMMIDILDSSEQ